MTARPTPETDREDIIITKGKPTHWVSQEFARKLEHERDEAKFDLDFRRRLGDFQNKTIDDLTAQLDEAREQHQILYEQTGNTIYEARKQRDRLAEALELFIEEQCENRPHEHSEALGNARKALQSLTPNV